MPFERWLARHFYTLTNLIEILQAEHPELAESVIHERALAVRREHYRLKKQWDRSQLEWRRHTELSGLRYEHPSAQDGES